MATEERAGIEALRRGIDVHVIAALLELPVDVRMDLMGMEVCANEPGYVACWKERGAASTAGSYLYARYDGPEIPTDRSNTQMAKQLMFRQGDVLIVATTEIPDGATHVERDSGRVVLAYGEVTGHAHAIADRGCDLLEVEGLEDRFLRVLAEGGVELRHEEHATIALPQGDYVVRRQREYSPEEVRRVAD